MYRSPLRVVIVEDNPADARLLLHELHHVGFDPDVSLVESESEYNASLTPLPDLVLCDFNLPRFDALRALDILRSRDRDIPFIIVSGSIGEETAVNAIKRGATDYLLKDRLGRLGNAVQHAINQRRLEESERFARMQIDRDAMILANIRDSVIVTDLNGIVTLWNEGATRLFGWTAEEMLGRHYADRFPEPICSFIKNEINSRAQGIDWIGEFEDWRKDGSRIWIDSKVTQIHDSSGKLVGILGISRDISERKRAETAEQALQKFLQATLNALSSHIAVLDHQGNILAVNKAWERYMVGNGGVASACGVGANYFDVCHRVSDVCHDETDPVLKGIQAVLSGEIPEFKREYPCFSPSEQQWYQLHVTRFEEEPPRAIVAHENITAHKLAEIERERTQEQLQRVMRQANCLLWQADVWENYPEFEDRIDFDPERGTVIYWNLKIINQTDDFLPSWLPLDRAQNHSMAEALQLSRHPDDEEAAGAVAREALKSGKTRYTQTFRNRMSDGSFRHLYEDVRIDLVPPEESDMPPSRDGLPLQRWRLTGVVTDVTERLEAERALRASEERFRSTLENLIEGCFIVDTEWRYLYVNASGAQHARKPAKAIIGRTMLQVFPGIELTSLFSALRRSMEDRLPEQVEAEFFYEDGASAWFQFVLQPVPEGLFILTEDITERKRAERALQRAHADLEVRVAHRTEALENARREAEVARAEAESANRAKSEFLSRMSHELRTPLNAVLGFGQILERQNLTPLQKESVDYILSGGRHLLDLINEILDIARVESGRVELNLEAVSISEVLAQSWDLVRPLATKREIALVDNACLKSGLYAFADHQRFKQVLINLLSNAVKYNRSGGTITVHCESMPEYRIRIAVKDTGMGISPEDLKRLFTPFERLNASSSNIEGTGLGLSLSRGLVQAMGGTLTVESVPGEGSTFIVELPQTNAPVTETSAEAAETGNIAPVIKEENLYTVLCIEDKLSNLNLLEAVLEMRSGVKLLAAMQGSIGLDLARQHDPDLILLDLNLPDLSGMEVLERLRRSGLTRDIPVIIISADATQSQMERLLDAGAQAYLTKPLDVARFLQLFDTILKSGKRPTIGA